jgi:hypothetical protein
MSQWLAEAGHLKVIEKTLPDGRVLGIVPFGGAGVSIGGTFSMVFELVFTIMK